MKVCSDGRGRLRNDERADIDRVQGVVALSAVKRLPAHRDASHALSMTFRSDYAPTGYPGPNGMPRTNHRMKKMIHTMVMAMA